uniref:Uncharacterized protein n=1 Tax=Faecalibaculum rodentium TaxID=1702221 RepID=A0A140DTG5_9FIRM|nr:hypothetical protein AALO17_08080 [Faecalibaculum rodentium]
MPAMMKHGRRESQKEKCRKKPQQQPTEAQAKRQTLDSSSGYWTVE